jgi:hypothetical protein
MLEFLQNEISELHAFFEAWYRGTIKDTNAVFQRLSDVLAPEYLLITSEGYTLDRDQVLSVLRSAHAKRPDVKIFVKNIHLRIETEELIVMTYEEHGTTEKGKKATLISAVLRKKPGSPNGVEWLHIHEVNLPSPS